MQSQNTYNTESYIYATYILLQHNHLINYFYNVNTYFCAINHLHNFYRNVSIINATEFSY